MSCKVTKTRVGLRTSKVDSTFSQHLVKQSDVQDDSAAKLYHELIKHFHPDVSRHPEAKKRTILINKAKGKEAELYHLAVTWGVPIPAGVEKPKRSFEEYKPYDCFILGTDLYLKYGCKKFVSHYRATPSDIPGYVFVSFSTFQDAYYVYVGMPENWKKKIFDEE
jgi:hypothetical protein